jgi:hypothetical protein
VFAAARAAFGALAVATPGVVGRAWVGAEGGGPGAKAIVRSFAVRDAVLGLGALSANANDGSLQRWTLLTALADATDLVAMLLAPLPNRRRLALALASSAGLIGDLAAYRVSVSTSSASGSAGA